LRTCRDLRARRHGDDGQSCKTPVDKPRDRAIRRIKPAPASQRRPKLAFIDDREKTPGVGLAALAISGMRMTCD
jgi:hypothetical protein